MAAAMWGMVEAEINIAEAAGDSGMLARAFAKMEALSRQAQATTVQQHNVSVSNSVIGAVTTGGSIQTLNVRVGELGQRAETAQVAAALQALRDAVSQSKAITPDAKGEVVGQLAYLADQAAKPPEQREPAAIKPVLVVLRSTLALVADLIAVWDKWGPVLAAYFLAHPK
jgi:hypothetical protein